MSPSLKVKVFLSSALAVLASGLFLQTLSIVPAQRDSRKKPHRRPRSRRKILIVAPRSTQSSCSGTVNVSLRHIWKREEFYGGKLKLHNAIQGSKLGGVGAGVNPKQALDLGLKVDAEAVPKPVVIAGIKKRRKAI